MLKYCGNNKITWQQNVHVAFDGISLCISDARYGVLIVILPLTFVFLSKKDFFGSQTVALISNKALLSLMFWIQMTEGCISKTTSNWHDKGILWQHRLSSFWQYVTCSKWTLNTTLEVRNTKYLYVNFKPVNVFLKNF